MEWRCVPKAAVTLQDPLNVRVNLDSNLLPTKKPVKVFNLYTMIKPN